MLERAIDIMGPGQETLALIVNFKETKSGQNASIGQAKQLAVTLLRVLVGGQEIQTWPSVVIIAQNDLLARFVPTRDQVERLRG
jgi:hypothetical protein